MSHLIIPPSRQQGVVLIVALIMLALLSIIGIAGMRSTLLEERMAGNLRDHNLAFQAAEAALREGELNGPGDCAADGGFDGSDGCYTSNINCIDADTGNDGACWPGSGAPANWADWEDDGRELPVNLTKVDAQPRYVIELVTASNQKVSQSLKQTEQSEAQNYYRITAWGVGGNENTVVVLQSTYLAN